MRTRTTRATAAMFAAGALFGWLAASGRLALAQDAPKEVHEPVQAPRAEVYAAKEGGRARNVQNSR